MADVIAVAAVMRKSVMALMQSTVQAIFKATSFLSKQSQYKTDGTATNRTRTHGNTDNPGAPSIDFGAPFVQFVHFCMVQISGKKLGFIDNALCVRVIQFRQPPLVLMRLQSYALFKMGNIAFQSGDFYQVIVVFLIHSGRLVRDKEVEWVRSGAGPDRAVLVECARNHDLRSVVLFRG